MTLMIHFCHTFDVESVGIGDGSKFRGGGLHSDRHGEGDSDCVLAWQQCTVCDVNEKGKKNMKRFALWVLILLSHPESGETFLTTQR